MVMTAAVCLLEHLSDILSNKKQECVVTTARLFREAVDALCCLHQAGWFHGDVRPKNFVVLNDHSKLIDFVTTHEFRYVDGKLLTTCQFYQQGNDPFMYDDFVNGVAKVYKPKWDFIFFGILCNNH